MQCFYRPGNDETYFLYIFNISTVSFGTLNVNFSRSMFGTKLRCSLVCIKHSFCRSYSKHVDWPNHLTAGCLSAPIFA